MESAEIIIKALEKIDVFMESARKQEQDNLSNVQRIQDGNETLGNLGIEMDVDDNAVFTLVLELTKLHLKNIEQLIESMKEIQKILFSTRNKSIEEAIKYIEYTCDENDNNFNNQLRLKRPKYRQWLQELELLRNNGDDTTEVEVDYTVITRGEILTDTYKALAIVFHPDKGGDTERFKKINNAYEQLKGKTVRAYDALRPALAIIMKGDDISKLRDIQKILAGKKPESS